MKKGVYIRNPSDARRLLSRMINDCCMEKTKPDTLRAVSYSVSVLMKIFEIEDAPKKDEIRVKVVLPGEYPSVAEWESAVKDQENAINVNFCGK